MNAPVEIIKPKQYRGVSGIYSILHIQTGKIYVGSSCCIKSRIFYHISKLRHNKHDNCHLQNAWNKYGEKDFKFFVLQLCQVSELSGLESLWMSLTACCCRDYGYNLDSIAIHKMHSEETKLKIANGNRGKIFSEERKRKISIAALGRKVPPRTPEQRENHRRAAMGHFVSEESRRKMSAIHKGKTISEKHRQQIRDAAARKRGDLFL
jgi:group I intron endonuclease